MLLCGTGRTFLRAKSIVSSTSQSERTHSACFNLTMPTSDDDDKKINLPVVT